MNKHLIPLLMMITSVGLWLIFFNQLPDQVPMQWGPDGSVNWYASKGIAFLVNNGLFVFIYLLLYFIPKIDPKRRNYEKFSKSYRAILYAIMGVFLVINLFVLFTSLGYDLNLHFVIPIAVGILFIIMGNYMQTVKPNWFFGIRTPWTLDNEEVWRKTHRFGSKVFIVLGFLIIAMPFLPNKFVLPVLLITVGVGAILPIGYSYYLHRKLN